jgi:hypothetical protein
MGSGIYNLYKTLIYLVETTVKHEETIAFSDVQNPELETIGQNQPTLYVKN